MDNVTFGTLIVIWLICGAIAAGIGQAKNRPVGESFVLGLLLGIIGVIIVILLPRGLPKAPPGMWAMKCPRCNAVQNVPQTQSEYECWQCKLVQRIAPAPQSAPSSPNAAKPLASGKSTKARCHHCQHVQLVPVEQQTFVCEQCGTQLKRLKRRTERVT